jgi:ubiquinone/menaquinone biosynthesis C-methylase UbiE
MNDDRKLQEKHFFDKTFETEGRKSVHKFYKVVQSSRSFYENCLVSNCKGKAVIEYGCGKGTYAFVLAKHAARVVGIDISEVAIKMAQAQANEQGLKNIDFSEQDAEAMDFEDGSFDIIFGTSILHHLNLEKAMIEISRVLKSDGRAVFIEPLGHNPLINLYRKMTPHYRTDDEHPLTMSDLRLIKQFFNRTDIRFFHLFSLVTVPFRNLKLFPALLKLTDSIDNLLFKIFPFLKPMAWQVVLILENPKSIL